MHTNEYSAKRAGSHSAEAGERRRLPLVTAGVLLVTAIFTGLQFVNPAVLSALRRNPAALAAGEWWRMFTPLLVHSDGPIQIIINFVGIALVGPAVEQAFGRWRWLILYLGAGLVAEAISYVWEPYGAGASIALAGLIGGLLTWRLRRDEPVKPNALVYAICLVAALLGLAVAGFIAGALLAALAGSCFGWLLRRNSSTATIVRFVGFAGFGGALALTVLRDNHGPPIIVGGCLAALMLWYDGARASPALNTNAKE